MSSAAPSSSSRFVDVRSRRTPDLRENNAPPRSRECAHRLAIACVSAFPLTSPTPLFATTGARQQEPDPRHRGAEGEHPGGEICRAHAPLIPRPQGASSGRSISRHRGGSGDTATNTDSKRVRQKKKPRPASVFSANATIARRELTPPSLYCRSRSLSLSRRTNL